jgi:uncharacterized protein YegP (UPF0339 family)
MPRTPKLTVELEKVKAGTKPRWFWSFTSGNGQVMCSARGFSTKSNAVRNFRRTQEIITQIEVD